MTPVECDTTTTTVLQPIELGPLPATPLVSILISNFNYARFIGESIESALEQTYTNIELIVCDDGSTDDSVSVIEEYERRDPRLRLVRKANGGQASGFNAAYHVSQGEIIALLDSDDLFLPEKVERIVENFQQQRDAGFGLHRVFRISVDHHRQGVWPMSAPLPAGWYGPWMVENGGVVAYMPPTSGLSFRREVAARMFPLPLENPLVKCPDQLITRLAPLLTRVTKVDEALAEYRLHGENNYGPDKVSTASFRRELDYCEALWGAQKRYLDAMDPALGERFQPLELNTFIRHTTYLWARFARDRDVRRHYDRYMQHLPPGSRHRWFWLSSIYMPLPVFEFAINLLVRQSWLKQLVARFKKLP